jgi:pSer/pThr/pTyr-binding forkhead associated (FHA) protein
MAIVRLEGSSPEVFLERCRRPVLLQLSPSCTPPKLPVLGPVLSREERTKIVKGRVRALIRDLDPLKARLYLLPASPATLGTAQTNSFFVKHESLAASHARFSRGRERWEVVDLESRSGTVVESRRLPVGVPCPLWGGEVLRFGGLEAVFLFPNQLYAIVNGVAKSKGARPRDNKGRTPGGPLPAQGMSWRDLVARDHVLTHSQFLRDFPAPFLLELEPLREGVGLKLPKFRTSTARVHSLVTRTDRDTLVIGRRPTCEIIIPNLKTISTRHAELRRMRGGRWGVMDLESQNGTSVDGVRLRTGILTPIRAGQVLGFSVYRARFLPARKLGAMLQDLRMQPKIKTTRKKLATRPPVTTGPVVPAIDHASGEDGLVLFTESGPELEVSLRTVNDVQEFLLDLERRKRTGTLTAAHSNGAATLTFCRGRVLAASNGPLVGIPALEGLCLADEATIRFVPTVTPSETNMDVSLWKFLCTDIGTAQVLRAGIESLRRAS